METNLVRAGTTRAAPSVRAVCLAGWVLFVLTVAAEPAIGVGVGINQSDSAAKIAGRLADHTTQLVVVEGFCVVHAAMLPIHLWKLHDRLLRAVTADSHALGSLLGDNREVDR